MVPICPEASLIVFDWLRESDPLPPRADVAIGFGHFDLRIPRVCGELFNTERVNTLIFTGGIGAGTADLGGLEAEVFSKKVRLDFPSIAEDRIWVESNSTNTAENIRFTLALLERDSPTLLTSMRLAILVAHPARLRRVRQTWRRLMPHVACMGVAPETDLQTDSEMYRQKSMTLLPQIVGEMQRLESYAAKGWIEPIAIPPLIAEAARLL